MAVVQPFGKYVWLFFLLSTFSVPLVLITMDQSYFFAFKTQRREYIFEGKNRHSVRLNINLQIYQTTHFTRGLLYALIWELQGSAKRLRPGLENMRRKNRVLLPAAGRRTQFFLLIFTKPGRSLFAEPCILGPKILQGPAKVCFLGSENMR